jgi:hypothetical protein
VQFRQRSDWNREPLEIVPEIFTGKAKGIHFMIDAGPALYCCV